MCYSKVNAPAKRRGLTTTLASDPWLAPDTTSQVTVHPAYPACTRNVRAFQHLCVACRWNAAIHHCYAHVLAVYACQPLARLLVWHYEGAGNMCRGTVAGIIIPFEHAIIRRQNYQLHK